MHLILYSGFFVNAEMDRSLISAHVLEKEGKGASNFLQLFAEVRADLVELLGKLFQIIVLRE